MDRKDDRSRAELERIEALLRQERARADAFELDRIKLRAISRASVDAPTSSRGRLRGGGLPRSRRVLSVALIVGLLGGGTVFAASGGLQASSSQTSAAQNQYCPPSSPAGTTKQKNPGPSKCGKSQP